MGPAGPMGAQGATGATGATGAAAGFGTPTATATALSAGSTPTVSVTASGPDTAKVFSFEFGIPAATTTFDALYANGNSQTVAAGGIIPLTLSAATDGTTMTVSDNAITLADAGIYAISFGATGTLSNTTAGNFSIRLYSNGTGLDDEIISNDSTSTATANVSKSILFSAAAGNTISIYSASADEITIASAYITVVKLF